MKPQEKKQTASAGRPASTQEPKKQSSGDKNFDAEIDKLLKKPVYLTPAK